MTGNKNKKKKKSDSRGYSTTSIPKKDILPVVKNKSEEEEFVPVKVQFEPIENDLINEQSKLADHGFNKEFSLLESACIKAIDNDKRKMDAYRANPAIGKVKLSKQQESDLFKWIGREESAALIQKQKWNSFDLKLAYMRLEKLGFPRNIVEDILESCPFNQLDEVLQWACIHIGISELPPSFTDKFEHDEIDNDLQIVHHLKDLDGIPLEIRHDAEEGTVIDEMKELLSLPNPNPNPVTKSDDADFNKRWILERAEAQSDEESSTYSDTPKQPSRAKLETELVEWSEKAAEAKANGQKDIQKQIGKEIGRLKQLLGATAISVPKIDNKTFEAEDDIDGDMFLPDGVFQCDEVDQSEIKGLVRVREMKKSEKKWTGMDSVQLLQELVSKKFNGSNIKYKVEQYFANAFQATVSISHTVYKFKMDIDELVSVKEDAKSYVATKALYLLTEKDTGIISRLPPAYGQLYKEWLDTEREALNEKISADLKKIDMFAEKIMTQRDSLPQLPRTSHASTPTPMSTAMKSKNGVYKLPNISEWEKRISNPLMEQRQKLPVFQRQSELVDLVESNQVVVLSSETGSGKSTQVPTFLLQHAIQTTSKKFSLVCTQPRRISAVSLASRVAQEIGYANSSLVGYQVKNDSTVTDNTLITFCTTGLLLRRMVSDPLLSSITHIIIDECHERSVDSDFLLLLVKKLLPQRTDLRIVLMSATADSELFAGYFKSERLKLVPTITVPGRSFPVTALFLQDIIAETKYEPASDSEYVLKRDHIRNAGSVNVSGRGGKQYKVQLTWQEQVENDSDPEAEEGDNANFEEFVESRAMKKADKIMAKLDPKRINYELISHIIRYILDENPANCDDGSCIVFLPGVGEINRLSELLDQDFAPSNFKEESRLLVLPLHGGLTNTEQTAVFASAPKGKFKIVLATNVAETGVTIPDAVYVIDTLRAREIRYDAKRGMNRLSDTLISQANAKQRRGRAGRVRAGFAFHLIPFDSFNRLSGHQTPEMQRVPLEEVCLKMRAIGLVEDLHSLFEQVIDPPPVKSVAASIKILKGVEALDMNQQLTRMGEVIGQIPADIRVGKLLITGAWLGCLDSALTICSLLSAGKSPFLFPSGNSQQAKIAHSVFHRDSSDIMAWAAAYWEWNRMFLTGTPISGVRMFCQLRFLNFDVMMSVYETRLQLLQSLSSIGLVPSSFHLPKRQSKYPRERLDLPSELNKYSKNAAMTRIAYSVGLYPNVAFKSSVGLHLGNKNLLVKLHGNSTVDASKLPPSSFLTYHSIQIKSASSEGKLKCYLFDLNIVDGIVYPLLAANIVEYKASQGVFYLDEDLVVQCLPRTASVLLEYRSILKNSFAQFLSGDRSALNSDALARIRGELEKLVTFD